MTPLLFVLALQTPRYTTRAIHDPDGIGKFYMGREIAQVMGHQAADWLDRPEREQEEAPSRLIEALKLRPGMTVVDIGAGSGTLSFPMAQRILPGGKVTAEDIQPEMLDLVKAKAQKLKVTNVVPLLGTTTDPKVEPGSADLMIMVDVYHEFDQPYEMVSSMIRGLKKGGRIVFVEYRKEDPQVPIKELHKMSVAQVRKEMSVFPMTYIGTNGILPRQHIITFEKQ
ncbi:methyltransferase domain-containing protein [bacterium]|nr:MAG: methyltransferase domain-containing protein [bacterium]